MISILDRFIGGVFLVIGTSVGAGMIGLPFKTAGINFYLVIIIFFLVWIVMFITAIAMLEVSLWIGKNVNLITICNKVFGKKFSYFVCFTYLLFLYSLMVAYISGGSNMLFDIINFKREKEYGNVFISFLFTIPFVVIVFFGIKIGDYVNRIFVFFLILFYLLLIFKLFDNNCFFNFKISYIDFKLSIFSLPIIVTSFGYHLLIPSLSFYLFKNIKALVIVIFIGSFIPFCVYVVWEYVVLVKLSNIGRDFFFTILNGNYSSVNEFSILIGNNDFYFLLSLSLFSFFALSSSLIGVSIGMFDFFVDLFGLVHVSIRYRMLFLCLIFALPLILNIYVQHCFIFALSYAGIFASILLIIVPTSLLWYGRYVRKFNFKYILIGGKPVILFAFSFGFVVIISQLLQN
ncbi:MAG TPA: aromatic amino acid transport family protein [Candidatus Azoamicus sp. OHIO1]